MEFDLNNTKQRLVKHKPSQETTAGDLEYYTTRELAKLLKLSMSTLAGFRRQGIGPKFIKVGYRTCRYLKREVLKYHEENTHASILANKNYDLDFKAP